MVDLPLPLGPTSAIFSPLFAVKLRYVNILISVRVGYVKATFLNSTSPFTGL